MKEGESAVSSVLPAMVDALALDPWDGSEEEDEPVRCDED